MIIRNMKLDIFVIFNNSNVIKKYENYNYNR